MIIGFLKLQLKWKRFRKIKILNETLYLFKFRDRDHFPLNMSKDIFPQIHYSKKNNNSFDR